MAEMPTPDLAVPYAAPKQVKTMAEVQPMAPKKGWEHGQYHVWRNHYPWSGGDRRHSNRDTNGIDGAISSSRSQRLFVASSAIDMPMRRGVRADRPVDR